MTDELLFNPDEFTIGNVSAARTFTMSGADGRQATVDFSGAEVTYSGDLPVSDAAKIFFDAVGHHIVGATK